MHLNCGYTLSQCCVNVNDFLEKFFEGTKQKDLKSVFRGFKSNLLFGEKINTPFTNRVLKFKESLLSV